MKEIAALKNLNLKIGGGNVKIGSGLSNIFFGSVLNRTMQLFGGNYFVAGSKPGRNPAGQRVSDSPLIKIIIKNKAAGTKQPVHPQNIAAQTYPVQEDHIHSQMISKKGGKSIEEILSGTGKTGKPHTVSENSKESVRSGKTAVIVNNTEKRESREKQQESLAEGRIQWQGRDASHIIGQTEGVDKQAGLKHNAAVSREMHNNPSFREAKRIKTVVPPETDKRILADSQRQEGSKATATIDNKEVIQGSTKGQHKTDIPVKAMNEAGTMRTKANAPVNDKAAANTEAGHQRINKAPVQEPIPVKQSREGIPAAFRDHSRKVDVTGISARPDTAGDSQSAQKKPAVTPGKPNIPHNVKVESPAGAVRENYAQATKQVKMEAPTLSVKEPIVPAGRQSSGMQAASITADNQVPSGKQHRTIAENRSTPVKEMPPLSREQSSAQQTTKHAGTTPQKPADAVADKQTVPENVRTAMKNTVRVEGTHDSKTAHPFRQAGEKTFHHEMSSSARKAHGVRLNPEQVNIKVSRSEHVPEQKTAQRTMPEPRPVFSRTTPVADHTARAGKTDVQRGPESGLQERNQHNVARQEPLASAGKVKNAEPAVSTRASTTPEGSFVRQKVTENRAFEQAIKQDVNRATEPKNISKETATVHSRETGGSNEPKELQANKRVDVPGQKQEARPDTRYHNDPVVKPDESVKGKDSNVIKPEPAGKYSDHMQASFSDREKQVNVSREAFRTDEKIVKENQNPGSEVRKTVEDKTVIREDDRTIPDRNRDKEIRTENGRGSIQNPDERSEKTNTASKTDSDTYPDKKTSGATTQNPTETISATKRDVDKNEHLRSKQMDSEQSVKRTMSNEETLKDSANQSFSREESSSSHGKTEKQDSDTGMASRFQRSTESNMKPLTEPVPQRYADQLNQIREAIALRYSVRAGGAVQTNFHIERGPLGKMDISFYRGNGGNKITILVESELVKSELQKFIPVIQQGLQEKGIEPQTIQVDVHNSGDKQDNSTENKSEKGNFQNRTGKEDYEENIAHTENKRDYGYNTIEVIA